MNLKLKFKLKGFVLILYILMFKYTIAQDKPTLIYVGDPLCSWCYGFSPEIVKAKENLKDKVDFKLMMGGLRPYNTETMADLGDFLKEHWEHVHERSNQPFNYNILKDTSFVYDTEPPSRAVVVMRKLSPENEFAFFKDVQRAFYNDNKNTNLVETYLTLATNYGVDAELFKKEYESDSMKEAIKEDFRLAAGMGVRGFPTVILQMPDGTAQLVNYGYATSENLVQEVKRYLSQN